MTYIMGHYGLNRQRACRLVRQARSKHYYRSVNDPQTALRHRMREIAQTRVRWLPAGARAAQTRRLARGVALLLKPRRQPICST